jgi:hypothetical protein
MQILSNRRNHLRQRWRGSFMAVSMLAMLASNGATSAAAFDEAVKAPAMRTTSELRAQVEPFAAKYRAVRGTHPEQLVRDPALTRQKFDLKWQLLRAVEAGRPVENSESLGLISQGDGSYRIDLDAYPEWSDYHETIAGMLSRANLDATGPALIARGFRAEDLVTLKEYVASHDPAVQARSAVVPITLDFARVVRKFDKLKRPVPAALIDSFYYQRARAASESDRRWVEGLLQKLDDQRVRVLLSTFLEIKPVGIWAPSDLEAGSAALLAEMRKPDFEARVSAEAKGVAP